MYTVLLSGGSGKRLWPLSNDLRSKQYLKIIKGENDKSVSMIQRVWSQLGETNLQDNAIITAGKSQVEIIKSQLGLDVKIAIEPQRRDTFPAIALSCAFLYSELNAKDDDCVAILPVDPYTENLYFETVKMLESIVINSECDIALMGATPTYPSEKYGYIMPGENFNLYSKVKGFVEKPTSETAKDLIENGALWNCGVFCFKIGYLIDYLRTFNLPVDYKTLYENYERLEKISFDYKIVENCKNIAVVKFIGQWKDLGTWNTLSEEMKNPTIGNCIMSKSSVNTNVINELEIPLVVIGCKDLIVAASSDGILVSNKSESSHMKEYISDIGDFPMYEERRWGYLKVIDIGRKNNIFTMTRRINLNAKMNSSLHFHENRDEIWTILSGTGLLIRDGDLINIKAGDSVRIPKFSQHAIFADSSLDIIEIQIGESMGSEDITRILYDWDEIWQKYFRK